MISFLKKKIKMSGIKKQLIKAIKEHRSLKDIEEITNNETLQTLLKTEYAELGGKRFWEKLKV